MNDNFIYKGKWYFPNDEDNFVYGELSFDVLSGGKLQLFGKLKKKIDTEIDVIWGITSKGKYITLHKSFHTKMTFSTGEGFSESELFVNYILVGAHFDDENDINFYKAKVFYNHLDNWLNLKGFSYSRSDDHREINLNYNLPNHIKLLDSKKEKIWIKNSYSVPGKKQGLEMSIKQYSYFQFVWSKGYKLLEMTRKFYHIQHLLTLFIQSPILIHGLIGYTKITGTGKLQEVQIYFSQNRSRNIKDEIHVSKMLIPYKLIELEMKEYFQKWMSKRLLLKTVVNNFFSTFNSPFFYSSDRYLTVNRSIEAFHRDIICENLSKSQNKKIDYKIRVVDILRSTSRAYNHILKIKSKPALSVKVKNLRNIFTHANIYDDDKDKHLFQLHWLSERLSLIMTCTLLKFIGIPMKTIKSQIDYTLMFNHLERKK